MPSHSPGFAGAAHDSYTEQFKLLQGRDLQLWSIAFLMMLVLVLGLLSFLLPNLSGPPRQVYVQLAYLPQLAAGLIALVVLLNLYLVSQKRQADRLRLALLREARTADLLKQAAVIDPVTQLLDRRYLEHLLPLETARANRTGIPFALMLIETTSSLEGVRRRFGADAAREFLVETSRLLKTTFRGSDSVLRYGSAQFLVLLPWTDKQQAGIALRRLLERVDEWNLHTKEKWEMLLECRLAACQPGMDAWKELRDAEQSLQELRAPVRVTLHTAPAANADSRAALEFKARRQSLPEVDRKGPAIQPVPSAAQKSVYPRGS
jgi:diguanylate cyclase (GGDEF)-like protein